jgi:hypothetical protein
MILKQPQGKARCPGSQREKKRTLFHILSFQAASPP